MYSGSSRDDEAHLHTLELLTGAQSLLQQLEEEKGGWGEPQSWCAQLEHGQITNALLKR